MSLSQIELVWVRVRVERECFWVNLREENKVSESKMAEFKMAAIIKLSQNEWVKFFLCKWWEPMNEWSFFFANGGNQSWQLSVSLREKLRWLNPRGWNSRWQNSRWLSSSSWVRMDEFELDWISLSQSQSGERVFLSESERRKQGVWIQHGRIQDGCHHQVESEWMSEGFFLCKWWEPILASVSEFERKN